jgi:hypothetical protein
MSYTGPTMVTVDRVLGDGPFAASGCPQVAAMSPDGELVAVGGDLGSPQWHGHDVRSRSRPQPGWVPVGIYRTSDLKCDHLVMTHWPVNSIAFHPELPLVAIGTGSYDGGYAYEGELLFMDLPSGRVVSVLAEHREIRKVSWRDGRTLDVVVAPPTDEIGGELDFTVVRDDWKDLAPRSVRPPDGPYRQGRQPDDDELAEKLRGQWQGRRRVWAVKSFSDGRILAALEGVGLECWGSDLEWSLPVDGGVGCQIFVSPEGNEATYGAQPGRDRSAATLIERVDGNGQRIRGIGIDLPVVVVARADGGLALRDTTYDRQAIHPTRLISPAGKVTGEIELGAYDLFNHFFDIRYAPEFLMLQGMQDSWRHKWVVAAEPRGRVRRLFRLDWDGHRHLYGGPGLYVDDQLGASIVHTGSEHNIAGLLPGNAFVVRRAFPGGQMQWVFTADNTPTAIDLDGDTIYMAFNSGELVALNAESGAVVGREFLTVAGHPVIPLSLATTGAGRLAIGLLDGRILDCSVK